MAIGDSLKPQKARGAVSNPSGRFERLSLEADEAAALYEIDGESMPAPPLRTEFYIENAKSILTRNDSPDVGAGVTLNPYRGCEHGCIYCFARPTHEYLGLSAGLDFESRIFIKQNAAALLRRELNAPSWVPEPIMMSGATDCYQPVERKLQLTRACAEVLADFRQPVSVVTKNHLVTRDIDIFQDLAAHGAVSVHLSITTLDGDLARHLEPRTSRPSARLKAVETLAKAGIPVGVMMAPIIPGLTDSEIPALLKAAAAAGASSAGHVMLRLPYGIKDLLPEWLETHYPLKKNRVLALMRDMRGGKLYDSGFGTRMRGEGAYAGHIRALFALHRRRNGLDGRLRDSQLESQHDSRHDSRQGLSSSSFRRVPADGQMSLF